MNAPARVREYIRANRRGTFTLGAFDSIKANAAEIAHLGNKVAEDRVLFYAADTDKIIGSMRRIELELATIRIGLATFRRRP